MILCKALFNADGKSTGTEHKLQSKVSTVVFKPFMCVDLRWNNQMQNYSKILTLLSFCTSQLFVHCTDRTPAGEKDHRRLDVISGTTSDPGPIAQ